MAKIFNYTILLSGIFLLLGMAGVPTGSSQILSLLGFANGTFDIYNSDLYSQLSLIFIGAAAVAAIIASFTGRQSSESYIVAGFCALLISYIADMVSLINYVNANNGGMTWLSNTVILLFAPLIIGYGIMLVQYWRGGDI